MANRQTRTAPASKRNREPATLERARLLCPHQGTADSVAESFGLVVPDFEGIQKAHFMALLDAANAFDGALNEKATKMHFERVVGALVHSANGAGEFYTDKVSEARRLTSQLADEYESEEAAPVGFDSRAQRAREFAADMALQAYALLAAAEGAVAAYREITGEDWKPYVAQTDNTRSVERKSASAEMAAFG